MARKEQLKSWHEDKAVQDNIVESWDCIDCVVNQIYDVKDTIWKRAGMRAWSGCLCIGCLERRIGRQLRPKDFSPHDKKVLAHIPCTDRLLSRRGRAVASLVFVPENDDLVLYVELAGKRIAKRYSGENWISLEPGYTVRGSEPGADSSTLDIEYDPAKALPQ